MSEMPHDRVDTNTGFISRREACGVYCPPLDNLRFLGFLKGAHINSIIKGKAQLLIYVRGYPRPGSASAGAVGRMYSREETVLPSGVTGGLRGWPGAACPPTGHPPCRREVRTAAVQGLHRGPISLAVGPGPHNRPHPVRPAVRPEQRARSP